MPKLKYTKEVLAPIVAESNSTQDVMRKLGLRLTGGSNSHLKRKFVEFSIDTSHFGKIKTNKNSQPTKIHYSEVLVLDRLNGRRENVFRLRRALLELGVKHECAVCGLPPEWNGKPLQLQIDHIDGNGTNNVRDNLRFICGNCHSQTENFGVKNAKKKSK